MLFKVLLFLLAPFSSFYALTWTQLDGSPMSIDTGEHKKILVVNIATQGAYVQQISELQSLQQMYSDSLLILAFPSNSFGNELHSNSQLSQLLADSFHVSYSVSQVCKVKGINIHPVYAWLADSTQNGTGSIRMTRDFQKVLLDENGNVIGVFNSMVSPLDTKIRNAISN